MIRVWWWVCCSLSEGGCLSCDAWSSMENKRRLCLFISAVWTTAREWPIGGKTPFKVVDCRGSHGHHSVSHTDWLKLPIREWVRSLICIDPSDLHLDQLIPNAKCFYDFIRHTESQWRSSRQELRIENVNLPAVLLIIAASVADISTWYY